MFFLRSFGLGKSVCVGAMAGAMLCATTGANANTLLLEETFTSDPIAGGRATVVNDISRFTYSAGQDKLAASYDTGIATSKLVWDLGQTLTWADSFTFEVDMTIRSAGFFADPNGFAQIAFGLQNSSTTGLDRAGGSSADAFDVVTIDYFPNVSPQWGGPTLAPTVINTDDSVTGFFSSIQSPLGAESGLDDEGPLPLDVALHAVLSYDHTTRQATVTFSTTGGLLSINSIGDGGAVGGGDGDVTTTQLSLAPGSDFAVDQFGILLWEDTWTGGSTSVAADVVFDRLAVNRIPEPGTICMMIAMGLLGVSRRTRRSA